MSITCLKLSCVTSRIYFVFLVLKSAEHTIAQCYSSILIEVRNLRSLVMKGSSTQVCIDLAVFNGHMRCEECGLNILISRCFVFSITQE